MMPQNWWEMFPEVQPSPAARPRLLPGPGGAMPAAGMAPQARLPNAAIDPFQGPPSAFDPSYFAGEAEPSPVMVRSPFPGDDGAPPMDRGAAIQQAAAIQRGADQDAVHTILNQLGSGGDELAPPGPFPSLVPNGPQGSLDGYTPGQLRPTQQAYDRTLVRRQNELTPRPSDSMFTKQMPAANAISKPTLDTRPLRIDAAFQPDRPADPFTHMMADDERGVVQPDHARSASRRLNPVREGYNSSDKPAQVRLRLANQAALDDPRTLAFLDTIAFAEGADYNTLFGTRRTFSDTRTHPGYAGDRFEGSQQSAAGRYQIQLPNYNERVARMGPLDMSPESQDLMAIDILRRHGGLDALQANDFNSAVSNLSGQWASLPHRVNGAWRGSRYRRQRAIPIAALSAFYDRALQYYSAPNALIPPRKRPPLQVRRR